MQLPESIREALLNDLDEYLENLPEDPDPEMVSAFLIEQLEVYADERGIDDIIGSLEDSGGLDGPLGEALEEAMTSDADFEFTGEECVSVLETLCDIEWESDDEDEELEEEEEEDEDEDADEEL